METEELKNKLIRRLLHAQKRGTELKESHGDNPGQTHTYHGGHARGLWDGMSVAYCNVLDEIDPDWDKGLEGLREKRGEL